MADDPTEQRGPMNWPVIWVSGVILFGAAVWNGAAGEWMDSLFLLGLGLGGAFLIGARWRERSTEADASALRWTGVAILGGILLVQIALLLRYLLGG